MLVKIFEDVVSDQGEEEQDQNIAIIETNNNFHVSLGDWVLVEFPGEVTTTVGLDFEVSVMHKSGNEFWKWPSSEDKVFYQKQVLIKKMELSEVSVTCGQF